MGTLPKNVTLTSDGKGCQRANKARKLSDWPLSGLKPFILIFFVQKCTRRPKKMSLAAPKLLPLTEGYEGRQIFCLQCQNSIKMKRARSKLWMTAYLSTHANLN
jgi:hypothetical protein